MLRIVAVVVALRATQRINPRSRDPSHFAEHMPRIPVTAMTPTHSLAHGRIHAASLVNPNNFIPSPFSVPALSRTHGTSPPVAPWLLFDPPQLAVHRPL